MEETVRKIFSLVVVFLLLVGVAPASAQGIWNGSYRPSSWDGWMYYLQGDQVHMLLADNVNWVAETMNIGRRAQMRYVANDLIGYGSYVGLRGPQGFYPMYQCSKRQRWEKGIGRGLLTGIAVYAGGRIVGFSGKESAIAGTMVGGGYALLKDADCAPVQNQMVVIDDPSDLSRGGGTSMPPQAQMPGRENGWNERLRNQANAGGNPWFGSYRGCLEEGKVTLKNEMEEAILVYKDDKPYDVVLPRTSKCGDGIYASYSAEVVAMVVDGYHGRADKVRKKPEGRPRLTLVWR